jgi:hypothetical protein
LRVNRDIGFQVVASTHEFPEGGAAVSLDGGSGEVQIGVTGQPPDAAVMVDNGGPFFQSWCMHESIRRRGSKAV